MTNSTRVPRGIDSFNKYIVSTSSYLQEGTPTTHAARLGITEEELKFILALLASWTSLYKLYGDKKNSRTTAVIDQLHDNVDQFVDYDKEHHLLDRIASSPNATIIDMETFNIRNGALQRSARSTTSKPITDAVSAILDAVGGGMVSVKCYNTESSRPSIFSDSDCIQFAYAVGSTPPTSVLASGLTQGLSSKASFTISTGADNGGKNLYIFFRWYNSRHPELAGPWCAMVTIWLT